MVARICGYQRGQAAGKDASKQGYDVRYNNRRAIGYRTRQEEAEDTWAAIAPTNTELRRQCQA